MASVISSRTALCLIMYASIVSSCWIVICSALLLSSSWLSLESSAAICATMASNISCGGLVSTAVPRSCINVSLRVVVRMARACLYFLSCATLVSWVAVSGSSTAFSRYTLIPFSAAYACMASSHGMYVYLVNDGITNPVGSAIVVLMRGIGDVCSAIVLGALCPVGRRGRYLFCCAAWFAANRSRAALFKRSGGSAVLSSDRRGLRH